MKKYVKLLIALIFNVIFWIGIYDNVINLDPNKCEMTYMFEYPQYLEVKLENNPIKSYKIYVYGEGPYSRSLAREKYEGIPVLFIPGNQGSYKQVRSLASVALRKAQDDSRFHFNFFTVDFNEEIGAFFGPVLERQARFVGHAIRTILDLYKNSQKRPESVVLIGHSMGGLIARAVVGVGGVPAKLVPIIITLATPHVRPVIIPDSSLISFYETVNGHWLEERNSSLKDIVFVTVGGGKNDIQVPSSLTTSQFADVDEILTSVPLCWLTTDHLAIVWCKQLVLAVTRALFSSVDESTLQISTSKPTILNAFKQHLSEKFGHYKTFAQFKKSVDRNLKSGDLWTEMKSMQYSENFKKPVKYKLIAIPLRYDLENQHISILFNEMDSRSLVIACKANISSTVPTILSGENLHRYSRIIPGNRKEVNIDLLSMQGRDFTHLAAVIEPSSKKSSIHIDISDWESRNIVVTAPSLMSSKPVVVLETTPPRSLTLNVTIEGFQELWQSFTLSFSPLNNCISESWSPLVSLRSSWVDRWEQIMSKNIPFEFSLEVIASSPSESEGSVEVHIVKNPSCVYSISLQQNYRGMFEKLTLLFGPQTCAFVACHLLLAFSKQQKTSTVHRSIFSHFFALSPISVIPFAKLAAFGLARFGGIESDRSYLEKYRINIEVMPIILFLSTVPLTIFIVFVLRTFIVAVSHAVSLCFSRTSKQSTKSEEISVSVSHTSFLWVSSVGTVALLSIGASTCGTFILFLASGIYALKVVKMYMDLRRSQMLDSSENYDSNLKNISVDFHFTVLLLSLFVAVLNLPSLVIWVQNFSSQSQLESDPSLIVCATVLLALTLFNQVKHINPDKKFRKVLAYLIHLSAILVILFGTVYIYRVHEIVSFTLLVVALHEFLSP